MENIGNKYSLGVRDSRQTQKTNARWLQGVGPQIRPRKWSSASPARGQYGHLHTIKPGGDAKHGKPMDKVKDGLASRRMWESVHSEGRRGSN